MRPTTLSGYIGQQHLVGEGAVLRRMIDGGKVASFILWGPPGVGKTTLAQIIAHTLEVPFYTLSAVTSGVKDVRDVIDRARGGRFFSQANPILFIDEIHRFSKSQQDSLLGAVEQGIVTLIGATTENPSFEVIRPLLSRCAVYVLKPLEADDLLDLAMRALQEDVVLRERHVTLQETNASTDRNAARTTLSIFNFRLFIFHVPLYILHLKRSSRFLNLGTFAGQPVPTSALITHSPAFSPRPTMNRFRFLTERTFARGMLTTGTPPSTDSISACGVRMPVNVYSRAPL